MCSHPVHWQHGREGGSAFVNDKEIMAVLQDDVELLDHDCAKSPNTIDILAALSKLLVTQPLDQSDNEEDDDFEGGPLIVENAGSNTNRLPGAGFSQEMEDTIMEEVEASEPPSKFARHIILSNGTKLNKARALAICMKDQKTLNSTNRLRRVQEVSRFNAVVVEAETVFGVPGLLLGDPAASVIRCGGKLFLCIG
jgi:hypothetical protein